jgi:L-lactate dehydrogenase complex protein LldG
MAAQMSAREAILAAVRGRAAPVTRSLYRHPRIGDPAERFVAAARASYAQLHAAASLDSVPQAIMALLAAASAAPVLHVPEGSRLWSLPWHRAPGLALSPAPPSGEDAALAAADFGIAETGTLAFLAGPAKASSWHFLPGREIALVERASIVPTLEDVFAVLTARAIPSTLNLVTGPSRTADIEQTIERGAHGPRAVDIIVIG